MRLAYLNPCGRMGGAETSLAELLESMRAFEPGWELSLVLAEDGPLAVRARELGVQVSVVPFPAALARLGDTGRNRVATLWLLLNALPGSLRYVRRLGRILRVIGPDIIHTNGLKMHVLGVWGRPNGTPVMWHIRDYVSARSVMSRLLRLHARFCSVAIANSESVLRDLRHVCGEQLDGLCIYNAVDLKRYAPDGGKTDLDSLSGLPPAVPGTVRIGLVATLARWKGHAVFLRALSRLSPDLPIRAYVIGGPIYQTEGSQYTVEELRTLARELGIADRTGFTGFVQDSASAMRALDIVVHASTEPEPFGRVIAEAMACGRPVISSACGGSRELMTEGYNALAHPPGDEATLAEKIEQLVRDPELRMRIGRGGRATAERRFNISRLAAELLPVYRRVLVQSTAGGPMQSRVIS